MKEVIQLSLDPRFSLELEDHWFGMIVHSTVFGRYTADIKRAYRTHLRSIALSFGKPLYAFQAKDHDPLKRKFILSLGFTFDHYRYDPEGKRCEFYRFRCLD